MPQISKGDTFANSQQLTAARLNQLVDASTLLVGAITEQPSITANTLEATDSTIVSDAGTLKKATVGDILNSNLPVTTSSITGGTGVDITVTPAAGQKFDVNGAFEANSANITGNSTVGGNETVTGTLTVTGATTLTGGVASGFTVSGLVTSANTPTASGHLTNKSYVDGTFVTATKGYVRLPNGIIFQWGATTSIGALATQVQTFQIAFPTACLNVQATKITTTDYFGDRKDTHAVFAFTTTGFTMFNQHEMTAATYNWFAIGY